MKNTLNRAQIAHFEFALHSLKDSDRPPLTVGAVRTLLSVAKAAVECEQTWSQELPNDQDEWWWWNGDDGSAPIMVQINFSPTSNCYFAMPGQYGWTEPQELADMGGWWMKVNVPAAPTDDYDPTPYCSGCKAMKSEDCHCGPIAANE